MAVTVVNLCIEELRPDVNQRAIGVINMAGILRPQWLGPDTEHSAVRTYLQCGPYRIPKEDRALNYGYNLW